ncbi:MAG: prepilin-type N-terminal cleavage/methylation domain-containing protein [Syntrophobacteraceae bacterium]
MKKPNSTAAPSAPLRESSGFTLIELILATAISALVIGILSVCLSFTLRAWESTQNRSPDHAPALVDLLKRQLAEFDPTPIKFEEGAHPFFTGDGKSLAFATSHSVKAISQGVPVAVRYIHDPKSKTLFYAEIPLDPYHPKVIKEFMQATPSRGGKGKFRFFTVDLADFSLGYAGHERTVFMESWDRTDDAPVSVLLQWTTRDAGQFAQLLTVNSPFTVESVKVNPFTRQSGRRP